jgi:hypothetical protein
LKPALAVFVIGILVAAGAFAQSTATNGWEVLPSWGQLPAGMTMGAASQVATTSEGQIIVFRRMVPSERRKDKETVNREAQSEVA